MVACQWCNYGGGGGLDVVSPMTIKKKKELVNHN